MTIDDIKYRGFLAIYKVIGQCRPGICREERFIRAILATSDDEFERVKERHKRKIDKLLQMGKRQGRQE